MRHLSDPRHVVHYVAMSDERVDDRELMRRAAAGSRDAVAEIARRYVGFVYAAALRQVRDAHLAEDVTQAVFVILAQKAGRIKAGAPLHAWLFTTTRYAAAHATKLRHRRQFHERQAAEMRERERESSVTSSSASSSASERVTSMLDEGLAQLRESDRSAILLSYMAGKSWREVADALGTTEEAARKRVSRAVAQLRGFFARRGVATTAPAIVAVITSSAEASVPPALLGSITAAVTSGAASAGAAGSASSLIAKGAVHMMTWAHAKVAAAGAVVFLGTLGVAGAMVMHRQPEKPAAPSGADEARRPQLQAAKEQAGPFAMQLENGVIVEIVAVSTRGKGDKWWNADGSSSDRKFNDTTSQDDPPHSHPIVVRVTGGDDPRAQYTIPTMGGWSAQPAIQGSIAEDGLQIFSFAPKEGATTLDFTVRVAAGEWKDASTKQSMDGVMMTETEFGPVAWGECADSADGHTLVTVTDQLRDCDRRFVAVDQNGTEHAVVDQSVGRIGQMTLSSLKFPVALADVLEVQLRMRPFEQEVVIRNVSLVAGQATKPTLDVRKVEKAP